jgi:hypothetical protein
MGQLSADAPPAPEAGSGYLSETDRPEISVDMFG